MFSKMGISLKYFVKEYLSLHVVLEAVNAWIKEDQGSVGMEALVLVPGLGLTPMLVSG